MTSWANFNRRSFISPNGLSVLRAILGCGLPFLILNSNSSLHLLALCLFVLGALTDYWDGVLARRYSLESSFGRFLDPLADKILVLAPLCAFAHKGFYSIWWIVPIFIREAVITFCRVGWMLEGVVIGAEKAGKFKLGFQVAAVSASFLYFLSLDFSFLASFVVAFKIMTFSLLLISVGLTLYSGFTFLNNNRAHFESRKFAKFVSAVGVGLFPVVPGTWGSAFGLGIVFLTFWNTGLYLIVFLALLVVGYWAVTGLHLEPGEDPNFVVMDEVLGIMITFAGIPLNIYSVLAGFFLFRVFDVLKPPPLKRLEKFPGYWGILFDDLGAGAYVWIILLLFFH